MKDFFARINDFLFDFLGLILPGVVLLILLFLPLYVINLDLVVVYDFNDFFVKLNEIIIRKKDSFWVQNTAAFAFILFVIIYLIGHSLKVFSKIQYRLFESFVNRTLKPALKKLISTNTKIESGLRSFLQLPTIDYLFEIFRKTFSFSHKDYYSDSENARKVVLEKIKANYDKDFGEDWYSLYKFASIIIEEEGLKSKAYTYLAKYNFYRSLAFLFLINFVYLWWIYSNYDGFLLPHFISIGTICNFIMWFTFHEKFRRYWVLCGNETLMTVYYYLIKPENSRQ